MSKYILILVLVFIIPVSALAGNTAAVRVSFTIPQRVEIKEKTLIPQEEVTEITAEEKEELEVVEEITRYQGQKFIIKTVLAK